MVSEHVSLSSILRQMGDFVDNERDKRTSGVSDDWRWGAAAAVVMVVAAIVTATSEQLGIGKIRNDGERDSNVGTTV